MSRYVKDTNGNWNLSAGMSQIDDELDSTSINPVQNKVITNAIESMTNVLGAKNLCPNNNTNDEINSVQFTVRSDGSIAISGTASAQGYYYLFNNNSLILSEPCILSIGLFLPSNIEFIATVDSTNYVCKYDAKEVNIPAGTLTSIRFFFNNKFSGDIVAYPMIRPASITDDTYVPYAMTNRELTQLSQSMTSTVATIDSSSQIIKMGRLYIGNLRFTTTSQIAVGSSFITLPFDMPNPTHCDVSNALGYKLDILRNSIRANEAIPSGVTIVASFVACV